MPDHSKKLWINLDPKSLNRVQRKAIGGSTVSIGMSPFDLPERVRGFLDHENDRLVIEFCYLTPPVEETVSHPSKDGDVTAMVGKNSGRIHRIILKASRFGPPDHQRPRAMANRVRASLNSLDPDRRRLYAVTEQVVEENQDKLFAF